MSGSVLTTSNAAHSPTADCSCSRQPTVYILDNDAVGRRWARQLAESVKLPTCTFDSADELFAQLDADQPGCLILKMCLQGMTGLQVLQRLRAAGIHLPVIMVAARADVVSAVASLRGGAIDYLAQPVSEGVLLERIYEAMRMDVQNRRRLESRRNAVTRLSALSPRERQITTYICQGLANKQVAFKLGICVKTVEFHRARIMDKLGVDNVVELVRLVLLQEVEDVV